MYRNLNEYYKMLEVSRDASTGSIKRAYKRLAIRWHPVVLLSHIRLTNQDKNRGRAREAEEKFKQISQAYEIITNPFIRNNAANNADIIFGPFDLPGCFGDELEVYDFDQAQEIWADPIIESISTSSSSNSGSPIENQ